MTLALCADDRGGLSFHCRRQSRDRAVCSDLIAQGRLLWMEPYSRPLFPQDCPWIRTAEHPWLQSGPEDLCFLELLVPVPALEKADTLWIYRWNRHYPSDQRLPLPPAGWRLTAQIPFPGHSHDVITKEIYQR